MAAPHLHVVTPARSERGRRTGGGGAAQHLQRWQATRRHGARWVLSGHGIEGKHDPLMGLWQDDAYGTMCRSGLVETIQPLTGTEHTGRWSQNAFGRGVGADVQFQWTQGGKGSWGCRLRLSSSAVREAQVEVCAERRPCANGRAEVARSAVVREMAVPGKHAGDVGP